MNKPQRAFITGFLLFQFSEDFIGTHALGKQLLQNGFRFCFLCFFCSLSICLCLGNNVICCCHIEHPINIGHATDISQCFWPFYQRLSLR